MRIKVRTSTVSADPDMTPMIDMTFQLISFFMFVLNFSDAEQDERIRLPLSELAKPPEAVAEAPLTLQLSKTGTVLFIGDEVPVGGLKPYLEREVNVMEKLGRDKATATVIIRADSGAKAGKVQELIYMCQEIGFEKFALRAKQEAR